MISVEGVVQRVERAAEVEPPPTTTRPPRRLLPRRAPHMARMAATPSESPDFEVSYARNWTENS
jgi:hypothetical protein